MYARINIETGVVESQIGRPLLGTEGPLLPPPDEPGYALHRIDLPIDWSGKPSETSVMLWNDGAPHWHETATVAELRTNKNAEINSKRESLNTETFPYLGKKIRCRPLDRSDIDGTNGYIALFGEFPDDWAGGWKAEDNSYVAIATLADWKAFYKAMVDTGNANFRYAQQLKSLLAAAETPEQIAAIKWETPDGE